MYERVITLEIFSSDLLAHQVFTLFPMPAAAGLDVFVTGLISTTRTAPRKLFYMNPLSSMIVTAHGIQIDKVSLEATKPPDAQKPFACENKNNSPLTKIILKQICLPRAVFNLSKSDNLRWHVKLWWKC